MEKASGSSLISAKWKWLVSAAIIGCAIALVPTPDGLSRTAQSILGITCFSAILWAAQVMNNGVTSVLMLALMIIAGVRPTLALSGFSSPAFWILVPVLFYGCGMNKTGLAERVAYYILSLFPGSYSGILTAFFVIGFVLALGIPSMTVRTAILTPIAWALVQSLGLPNRGRGTALIMLTSIEMAVLPGLTFLYGSLDGPVVVAALATKHLSLTWGGYAQVMALPTFLLCTFILLGNQFVLRPEKPLDAPRDFVHHRLKGLGSFKNSELLTAIVVTVSISLWATEAYHHIPSYVVGMLGLSVFALTGIVNDKDIGTGVSWTLLLFLGGVFGLANIIQEYKVTDWLAGFLVPLARQLSFSTILVLVSLALAMYVLRFLDPSAFIAIPVLFLSVSDVTTAAGITPLVVMAPLLLASVPFWLSYQNFWIAMGEGITSNQAFTSGDRVKLATTYAVLTLITLVISVRYWKLIGALN